MTSLDSTALLAKLNASPDLSDTEKAYLRQQLTSQKKYGLIWEDKPELVEQQLLENLPVLTEVPERRVESVQRPASSVQRPASSVQRPASSVQQSETRQVTLDLGFSSEEYAAVTDADPEPTPAVPRPGKPVTHTLIEGDNLHALTVLNYTHAGGPASGQVDVIYIDPPYNTGNKDFKYNDTFVDREDSYRHSKWLSFMAKRLRLAKTLLKDTGVIFISIDDNEQAQLKLLCDEVFGEENFVANVIWQKKQSPQNDATYFSDMHDFVVTYAKKAKANKNDSQGWQRLLMVRSEDQKDRYTNPDSDDRGSWVSVDVTSNKSKEQRPNLYYPVINPYTGLEVWPNSQTVWRFERVRFQELINDNRVWWGANKTGFPRQKRFLSEVQDGVVPSTWWTRDFAGDNQTARREIRTIFGEGAVDFDTPKPVILIQQILRLAAPKNALVLDFFAGSGTTLHAVMALNAEDGGNRRCILVTNNENSIAEEVCYERNRRVIEGYTNSKGAHVPGLAGNALRYYKTSLVGRERTLVNKRALMRQATDLLCLKEGCYEEYAPQVVRDPGPEGGVPATESATPSLGPGSRTTWGVRLFANTDGRAMLIVYDPAAIDAAVSVIRQQPRSERKIKVYVFAPASYPYTDEFEDVADRIELCALPDAIYQAYEQAFNALRA